MKSKLFTTLLRLTASAVFVLGISYSYARAYDGVRGSYTWESGDYYQRYYGEYRYRIYGPTHALYYDRSYSRAYSRQYGNAVLTRYSNDQTRDYGEYSQRYYDDYSRRFVTYRNKYNYDARYLSGHRYDNYAPGNEGLRGARYSERYSDYQDRRTESSRASYGGDSFGINNVASASRYASGLQVGASA